MDSIMPMMGGLEATRCIRHLGYNGIIIGVTGNISSDEIQDFLNHGADAVLSKPLDIASYDLVVDKLLSKRHKNSIISAVLEDTSEVNEFSNATKITRR
mmetsp:Transcript_34898/g.35540  ORF Transcript_34898/g.35540 Transcript_34898/m.35540 type:complete len:99 (+) Transcript_34898:2-298(+)